MAARRVVMVPKSELQNPKFTLELRRVPTNDSEPARRGDRSHPTAPQATSVIPRVRSYSQRSGSVINPRSHGVWVSGNQSHRKPLEYEDIYKIRIEPAISRGTHPRYSMREGEHRVINGGVRNAWNQGGSRNQRASLRSNGRLPTEHHRGELGISSATVDRNVVGVVTYVVGDKGTNAAPTIEHDIARDRNDPRVQQTDVRIIQDRGGYAVQQQRDMKDSKRKGKETNNGRVILDTRNAKEHKGIIREQRDTVDGVCRDPKVDPNRGYTGNKGNHKEERGTPSNNDVHNDEENVSAEEREFQGLRWNPHQTSFPRHAAGTALPSQTYLPNGVAIDVNDANIEPSRQNVIPVTIVHKPQHDGTHSPDSKTPSSSSSSSSDTPPHIAGPPRPSDTERPPSPALSVGSVGSYHSNITQNSGVSAKSEVSVKSILKKPRVGRVILKEEPSSYTALAVLSCIFCFPFGIYALNKSMNVKTAVEENDYEWALSSSKQLKNFCIRITLVYLLILVIGAGFLAKYLITGNIF